VAAPYCGCGRQVQGRRAMTVKIKDGTRGRVTRNCFRTDMV